MVRRMTPSQARAAARKAQNDFNRAVNDYNRKVRQYNGEVEKERRRREQAVADYNRAARAHNSKAREHNRRVENQRQRMQQELRRLASRPTSTTFRTVRSTTTSFISAYETAERSLAASSGPSQLILDRASDEAANSVYLLNAFDGDGSAEDDLSEDELKAPSMTDELAAFGQDLVSRWVGALYALSPSNPDAARHFCTSAREVIVAILDQSAPDRTVLTTDPNCEVTDRNVPTRRAKLSFLLRRQGVVSDELTETVSQDMDNVLTLFRTFNDGTHGHAGRFTITELTAIRTRVESAIAFLHLIARGRLG